MNNNVKTMAGSSKVNPTAQSKLQSTETCEHCGTKNVVTGEDLCYQYPLRLNSDLFYITFYNCCKCKGRNVVQVDTPWTKRLLEKLTRIMKRKASGDIVSNAHANKLRGKLQKARDKAMQDYKEAMVRFYDGD